MHKCGQPRRKALITHVRWNRPQEGWADGNIELAAVRGAGDDLAGSNIESPVMATQ
jgi:hypothetical protein